MLVTYTSARCDDSGDVARDIRSELGLAQPDFSSPAYNLGADAGLAAAALSGDEEAAGADVADVAADAADADEEAGSTLRHYTTDDNAAGIERDGEIRPSADGNVYVTTDIYTNGADAQAGLKLTNTPTGYFEIPSDSVPNAQGPYPVAGGTGTEIRNAGSVNATGLTFTPFE